MELAREESRQIDRLASYAFLFSEARRMIETGPKEAGFRLDLYIDDQMWSALKARDQIEQLEMVQHESQIARAKEGIDEWIVILEVLRGIASRIESGGLLSGSQIVFLNSGPWLEVFGPRFQMPDLTDEKTVLISSK